MFHNVCSTMCVPQCVFHNMHSTMCVFHIPQSAPQQVCVAQAALGSLVSVARFSAALLWGAVRFETSRPCTHQCDVVYFAAELDALGGEDDEKFAPAPHPGLPPLRHMNQRACIGHQVYEAGVQRQDPGLFYLCGAGMAAVASATAAAVRWAPLEPKRRAQIARAPLPVAGDCDAMGTPALFSQSLVMKVRSHPEL